MTHSDTAQLKRQITDLQEANDQLLERARRAEHEAKGRAWHMDRCGQIAGIALGFPWFKDDQKNFPGATEENGVCLGEMICDDVVDLLALKYAEAKTRIAILEAHLTDAEPKPETIKLAVDLLVGSCYGASLKAGWWHDLKTGEWLGDAPRIVPEKLCLIHSEISEAMEGHRKNLKDDKLPHMPMFVVELADAIIRIADLAGATRSELGRAVAEKFAYNKVRPDHKVESRLAVGGKSY